MARPLSEISRVIVVLPQVNKNKNYSNDTVHELGPGSNWDLPHMYNVQVHTAHVTRACSTTCTTELVLMAVDSSQIVCERDDSNFQCGVGNKVGA